MSSEIAYLKMTKSEKEKQEEELHRALEDGAFIESSMRGELEQQHIRIEELELNILSLQVMISLVQQSKWTNLVFLISDILSTMVYNVHYGLETQC